MVDDAPPLSCSPGGPARQAGSSPDPGGADSQSASSVADGTDPRPASSPRRDSPARPLRVALAHDWIVAHRGGERVLAAIAEALATHHHLTRLYTMFHGGVSLCPVLDALPVSASRLNRAPAGLRRWLLPLYPGAVASLSARLARDHAEEPIDLLVSSSSAAIQGLRPPPGVPHLCYCHSPARYLWSQTDAYRAGGVKGRLRSLGLRAVRGPLCARDRAGAATVTAFLANSEHTRALIRHAYNRDAEVLHPPVRTDFFTPGSAPREGFLLVVSALEPYKRVDIAIDTAALAGRPLIVIGTGSHERVLRAHARANPLASVRFLGRGDDRVVLDHMRRAYAFLMPQVEDFGITAVEAQACGLPVVARGVGGALDTVLDARTGVLAHDPTPLGFADALARLPDDPQACRANALRFTPERFADAFLNASDRLVANAARTPGA